MRILAATGLLPDSQFHAKSDFRVAVIVHATDRGSQRVSFDLNATEKSPNSKPAAAAAAAAAEEEVAATEEQVRADKQT